MRQDSLDGQFWYKTSESGVETLEFGGAICTNFEVSYLESGDSYFEEGKESGVNGKHDRASQQQQKGQFLALGLVALL